MHIKIKLSSLIGFCITFSSFNVVAQTISLKDSKIIEIHILADSDESLLKRKNQLYYPVFFNEKKNAHFGYMINYEDHMLLKRNKSLLVTGLDSLKNLIPSDSAFITVSFNSYDYRFEFDVDYPNFEPLLYEQISFLLENLILNHLWLKGVLLNDDSYPDKNKLKVVDPVLLTHIPLEIYSSRNKMVEQKSEVKYLIDLSIISQLAKTVVVDFDLEIPYLLDSKKYYHSISESYTFKNTLE